VVTAYIGLGSNQGDRAGLITGALKMLDTLDGVKVAGVSGMAETRPLGGKDQGDYLNAVAKVETGLDAEKFFAKMAEIEDLLGRVRGEKWSSRTIDLDLLLYGDEIIDTESLTVPHIQMHLRSFVLNGVCELDADFVHPAMKRPMAELKTRLNGNNFTIDAQKPQLISIAGVIGAGKTTLAESLVEALDCELLREAYDKNPYLADEYAGKENVALESELFFLDSRIEQLGKDALAAGKIVVSDYVFEKQIIYAKQWLSSEQLAAFQDRNSHAVEVVSKPVLMIYLNTSTEICLERIRSRNRAYEQEIGLKMLHELLAGYERLLADWEVCPVMTVDTTKFDSMNIDDVNSLADEVRYYIAPTG